MKIALVSPYGFVYPGVLPIIFHREDGLLVSPKDSGSLAQALISVMSDETLREQMGAKGRLKAAEYSWERIAQSVLDYYVGVLNEFSHNKQSQELI